MNVDLIRHTQCESGLNCNTKLSIILAMFKNYTSEVS
ncbi:uncharacterized protein METZ01_LOCUS318549 [marine metagenome]|uniref:Uncharacterized protein n=1 Tax=marine metagenome TaxID=408172 RepID=A0A382NZB2_9ZZZZ